MRIRQGEGGKDGKGLLKDLTLTAADTNPVMILIVDLFATAAVADDRVTVANRAMSQDQFGAEGEPQSVSGLPTLSGSGITRIVKKGGSATGCAWRGCTRSRTS